MQLLSVYHGTIKTMCNTPSKIAVFTDGKKIKVFQKEFFRNNLNRPNWARNVNLEKYNNATKLNDAIISYGFAKIK